FLGSHIVTRLLNKGYRIRASARGLKVAELRETYAKFGNTFEAISVSDISTDEFHEALKGVDAFIHTAALLAERAECEAILKARGAVEGTLNVVRQPQEASIKRVVVTTSVVTAANPTCDQNFG
ncbi:hypothetical protein FPV67DRAFT_1440363, partial [Lyophyllum atratum]